jgi:hypothetical protein
MATITTRSGKGSGLTNNEIDANFNNLNDDKVEVSPPVAGGTANALTASINPTISAYETNRLYEVQVANNNTAATTINIDSIGATAIQTVDGNALSGGELIDGMIAYLLYNGTNFRLLNPFQGRAGLGCLVYLDSNQSVNSGADDQIDFDQESYDDMGIHDNVTNNDRLTVPT